MKPKLQEMRKKAGYSSAREYAESKGMPVNTYSRYEQGLRKLSLENAKMFAQDFKCSIDDIAGFEHIPTQEEDALLYYYQTSSEEGKLAIIATAKAQSELERKNIEEAISANKAVNE